MSLRCLSQTQEKMQQVANTHVQHVVNTINVEKPKIVKQTVQKPVIQEKINQVIKPIEVPQFLNEAVDMLDAVQRQVSMVQKIQNIIETSQLQFLNKVDEMPVAVQRQTPMVQTVQKTMQIPQQQCIDKVVDDPVVHVPQVQIVGKIDEIPEIRTDVGTQTSESLGAAPVSQAAQVEIVETVEIGAPIPAESGPPMFVKAPVLEIPVVFESMYNVAPTLNVAQAAPVTTSKEAPTVFPTTVLIAMAKIATVTVLKTLQLRNRVCYPQRKLHRKQRRFHRSDTLTKLWVCQLWGNAKH